MRAFVRRAGVSLFFTAALALASSSASADELLVMPYACTMIDGRPQLRHAPEQSHRIIGRREQRTHTACSPTNPDMCRSWTVHRFDLDCEGARVPWVFVVASMAEETRRAWLDGDRLVLRMPPSWSLEPDDPCARPPSFDDRYGFGRMRRYCADRRAMAPPPIVEMPSGFAPMLGIDGIFVKASGPMPSPPPPVAEAPPAPPPKAARAEPRTEPAPSPASRPEPRSEPIAADVAAQNAPAPKVAEQPPSPTIPALPVAPTAKSQASAPQASPPATPGGPVIPKIINRPETASTDAPERQLPVTSVPKSEPAKPEAATTAANVPSPSKEAVQPQPPAPPKAGLTRDDATISVNLLSVVRSPTMGIIAFSGLALLLIAAFAFARRRERLAGRQAHDIASVSLDSQRGRGQLVPHSGAPSRRPVAAPPPPPPHTGHPAGQREPAWVDRIPQTRAEALQMLGMGVSPDTTETAMKKIVDGLRQSWHPDLAKSEIDRQLREFRVKQINAAWDLIQGKRLERLDS
jgi:hypothetical protein